MVKGHGELKGQNHILAHKFVFDKDRDLQQTSLECPDQVQTCGGNWVKDKGQGHGVLKGQNCILDHNFVSIENRDLQKTSLES